MLAIRLPSEVESRLEALSRATDAPRPFMLVRLSLNTWMISKICILLSND